MYHINWLHPGKTFCRFTMCSNYGIVSASLNHVTTDVTVSRFEALLAIGNLSEWCWRHIYCVMAFRIGALFSPPLTYSI